MGRVVMAPKGGSEEACRVQAVQGPFPWAQACPHPCRGVHFPSTLPDGLERGQERTPKDGTFTSKKHGYPKKDGVKLTRLSFQLGQV